MNSTMKKITSSIITIIAFIGTQTVSWGASSPSLLSRPDCSADASSYGNYAEIDGIKMYYEDCGNGEPLVFIHPGFHTSQMWKPYVQLLSKYFRIITLDSRGHGRSTDGEGPITYGRMASDVVRLLDHLKINKANIVGHSDGSVISLNMLIDFPDRVRSAVLMGTIYNLDNYKTGGFELLKSLMESLESGEKDFLGFKSDYEQVAPDPSHFPILIKKLTKTYYSEPAFTLNILKNIERPVLVVKVDEDPFLAPKVFDDLAAAIPSAKIYHIPQGTHNLTAIYPEELSEAIKNFIISKDKSE